MRDLEFNSIYGSDHSDVNPNVKGMIDIAIYSKTTDECDDKEKALKDTKECMNNMQRARESSYIEVAKKVKAKAEKNRIIIRRSRDLSFVLNKLTKSDFFEIGE